MLYAQNSFVPLSKYLEILGSSQPDPAELRPQVFVLANARVLADERCDSSSLSPSEESEGEKDDEDEESNGGDEIAEERRLGTENRAAGTFVERRRVRDADDFED